MAATLKPRRRETTITAAADISCEYQPKISPAAASPENPWCCHSTRTPPHSLAHPPETPAAAVYGGGPFTKFNSALTAGLLNPMSPPPPTASAATRSSPTLFEMMANEPDPVQKPENAIAHIPKSQKTITQQRLYDLLSCKSPNSLFNDTSSGDVKLALSSKEGLSVCVSVHRQVLVSNSGFFATKLSDRISRNSGSGRIPSPGLCVIEIADCDEIEVYIETLRLMYCKDMRRRLMKEDVCKVLGILKISAAIGFNAGVLSCLEYLEAAPWAEEEEEKVASLLLELRLEGVAVGEVLKRVSVDINAASQDRNDNEVILLKLLHVVLEGKDEKARREMKGLVSKMLHESAPQNDLRKESLYSACDGCLKLLRNHFLRVMEGDLREAAQIARQADNLHWILDILIDRQIADVFLKTWASQTELSGVHSKVPPIYRYEISRVTARLFVGVGKGQLLASKESRCLLLQTWLVPFYEDFGWMRRATKGLDRHLIEEGLSNTILTLPLSWQQEIFMSWFDRFLNGGDDCPNMQRGFEVWWRRAFWKRNGNEAEQPRQMRISNDSS